MACDLDEDVVERRLFGVQAVDRRAAVQGFQEGRVLPQSVEFKVLHRFPFQRQRHFALAILLIQAVG